MSTAEQLTVVKHFLTTRWPHEPGPFVVLFNDGTILASTDDREVLHLGLDGDVLNEWEDEEPIGSHWDCLLHSCESSPKFLFQQDDELYGAIESLMHRAYRDVPSVDLMSLVQRMDVPHPSVVERIR